jgi:nitroreductase
MHVLEAIRTRRSIGKTTDQLPTREQIEQILEAATFAPNHHVTNPWRFVVIAGDERGEFGRVSAQSKLRRMAAGGRSIEGEEAKLIAKAYRAPVIIALVVEPGPTAVEIEEIEAGAAAAQNMCLAAHAMGMCTVWRTGDAAYDPDVVRWLGFAEGTTIIGFIYLGFPAITKDRVPPTPFHELTTWRGWQDGHA